MNTYLYSMNIYGQKNTTVQKKFKVGYLAGRGMTWSFSALVPIIGSK